MDHRTAPRFGQHLGALAAQLLHARSDPSESRQRREVGRARGTAPPCVPGSSKNRQRRAVWSRFLRFLVVLISISRPRQSARSGWGHCLRGYRRARSLASRSCYREDRARVKRAPQSDAAQSIVSGAGGSRIQTIDPSHTTSTRTGLSTWEGVDAGTKGLQTPCWRGLDSNLYGAFRVK
jgi:hypothetical protein